MAILVIGNGGTVLDVDSDTRAVRVTARPMNYGKLGAFRLGSSSGTLPASLAANSELVHFRWTDAMNVCIFHKFSLNVVALADATDAALVAINLFVARNYTANGLGGFTASAVTPSLKMDTTSGASVIQDLRTATIVALTVGARTLDANPIATIGFGIGTATAATMLDRTLVPTTSMLSSTDGGMPVVLAQNEGLVLRTGTNAFPAGLTWRFMVQLMWFEAARF
jgi:hypothetical protein